MHDEQWQRYARTGTNHLMAISGLHVGLAASTAYLLSSLLAAAFGVGAAARSIATPNAHLFGIVFAVAAAWAYTIVSGYGVPARRAALMLSLGALCVLGRR